MSKVCNFFSIIYIAFLLAIVGLNQTSRADYPLVALITTFSIFLFLPLILVLLFALWQRTWIGIGSSLIGLAILLFLHPVFPQHAAIPGSQSNNYLEVMTFNAGWHKTPREQIGSVLATQSADLIGLQEASPSRNSYYKNQLEHVYPYQAYDPTRHGIGLLSKYPIVREEWLQPPTRGRPILHAELDVDGQPLHVFVAHISWPTIMRETSYKVPTGLNEYWQAREIYFLQQQAMQVEGPVVILGDFNMSDQSHSYNELSAAFGDAFRDGGWGLGFTFPNQRTILGQKIETPVLRIDYIFYGTSLQVQEAKVNCFHGRSDHCALQAYFGMP